MAEFVERDARSDSDATTFPIPNEMKRTKQYFAALQLHYAMHAHTTHIPHPRHHHSLTPHSTNKASVMHAMLCVDGERKGKECGEVRDADDARSQKRRESIHNRGLRTANLTDRKRDAQNCLNFDVRRRR